MNENDQQRQEVASPPMQPSASHTAEPRTIPLGSSFNELFSGGSSVWLKIIGAAVAVPVAVVVYGRKATRSGSSQPFHDPMTIALVVAGAALLGAFLGGALSMKDIVERRRANSQPVAFPLRFLFGYGLLSFFLAWVPIGIFVTIIGMILFP